MEILMLCIGIVLGAILGIGIGMFIANRHEKINAMGRLRIDHSEEDEPARMFVELKGVTPDVIAKHKIVTFEVINESYISHN